MKLKSYIPALAMLAAVSFTACQDDLEDVENRVYDTGALQPSTVLIDGMNEQQAVSFKVSMALPIQEETTVTFAPDFSLVKNYNAIYNVEAIELPEANYELTQPTATFTRGAIESTNVTVTVKDINSLDRNKIYVLPLTIVKSPVPVLPSQNTRYIVVRGAALVNVAANMVENNASLVDPNSATALNGLNDMTAQCIINVDAWGGSESNIQSIMGIEGQWLLRISDSGLEPNQLQFVTPNGNLTDASWQLKDKQWLRLTFTWSAATGEATLYIDGAKKNTMSNGCRTGVSWGSAGFYIGKSWSDNRWLNGAICEVRVWNRILTDAEIADPLQAYAVPVTSNGLAAYWKFNEGAGSLIRDYANGNNLQCAAEPKWVETSLPEE